MAHGRLIAAGAALLVALLFAGRWTALTLTDLWWGEQISPAAGTFLLQVHLLKLALNGAAVLIAAAWFIGNLILVYRAVRVVQIPRYIANLEIQEALTPRVLLVAAVLVGAILGLVVGLGASEWWTAVALASQGVTYNVTEPLLNQDLGVYAAELPVWRALHGFATMLALLGLLLVVVLYVVIGSVRWLEGRPAISDHARRHLGLLLVAVALCLVWGYVLEPYELVAGIKHLDDAGVWDARLIGSRVLTGVALATALVSAAWGWWPRHTLVIASWIFLAVASVAIHFIVPGLVRRGVPAVRAEVALELERIAFGLDAIEVDDVRPGLPPRETPPLIPWDRRHIALLDTEDDETTLLAVNPATIVVQRERRPAWIMVRRTNGGRVAVTAVAAQSVTAAGDALAYRAGDTVAYPSLVTMLDLTPNAFYPGAPSYRLDSLGAGFAPRGFADRAMLAWALQAGSLLGGVPAGTGVTWTLSPQRRLERLAPFMTWDEPQALVIAGELMWVANGYVSARTFPLAEAGPWHGAEARVVAAGFLGLVDARSGETHVYHWRSDPLSSAWAALASEVVEPRAAIPEALAAHAPYPLSLFQVQAQVLERPRWNLGAIAHAQGRTQATAAEPLTAWPAFAGGAPAYTVAYAHRGSRALSAILEGFRDDAGVDRLRLYRLDSTVGLPVPSVLEARWRRFPLFEQVRDSVLADGGSLAPGPVAYSSIAGPAGQAGVVAWQGYFGRRSIGREGRPALAWLAVAHDEDMGAGRNPHDAWQNLLGESAPAPPGTTPLDRFDEARRWMIRADTALKAGRWEEFGRAFEALRRVLGIPGDSDQ